MISTPNKFAFFQDVLRGCDGREGGGGGGGGGGGAAAGGGGGGGEEGGHAGDSHPVAQRAAHHRTGMQDE